MIRLFAAIATPAETAARLAVLQSGVEGARWRELESLHLTLRFGGDLAEPVAEDFASELGRVTSPPFTLRVHGVGVFVEAGEPRAIWAGAQVVEAPADRLQILAARCEAAARRAGLAPQRRPFRPHVTLAYLRGADPVEVARWIARHNLLALRGFAVTGFGLYSSRRSRQGSSYRLERAYDFA
jgi:2'-5' RNA ligase